MSFAEVCIYQVKPQKVEEFETLMLEAKELLEQQPGLLSLRFIKRGYRVDMEQIRDGLPPIELTRVVKSVKYVLVWEFDSKENYGLAQKALYESYWKPIASTSARACFSKESCHVQRSPVSGIPEVLHLQEGQKMA